MEDVLKIVTDTSLTYQQQLLALAHVAENMDHTIPLSDEYVQAMKDNIICTLGEGNLPYRPRYIIPDYSILMEKGSKFLELNPPKDLWEACNSLLIMYRHVPSITSFPVYLGDLDKLLEPFVQQVSREEAKKCLGLFLLNIDRTLTDSFVHADIGPKDTLTGRLLLELTEEMQLAIPNLSLKYDPENISIWHNLSLCYMEQEDYDTADATLDSLTKISPRYDKAFLLKSFVQMEKKDTAEAIRCIDHSIDLSPYDGDNWSAKAIILLQTKQYKEAEECLDQSIRLSIRNVPNYINRAMARYNQNNLRGAMDDYDRALDAEPNNFIGRYNRGLLRSQLGDPMK